MLNYFCFSIMFSDIFASLVRIGLLVFVVFIDLFVCHVFFGKIAFNACYLFYNALLALFDGVIARKQLEKNFLLKFFSRF
jgi:hypothetical protein